MQTITFLENWVAEKKLPRFRAKQIYQAVTKNLISNWSEAIELPKDWQETLQNELPISTLRLEKKLEASNGNSIKIAFETHDNLVIESVLMRHEGERNTVCVSTQVGCPMNCGFCATGKMGFTRNLTAEEIVDQVLEFARLLKNRRPTSGNFLTSDVCSEKITNVVFMGMGEPFLNYENVIAAIKILNDSQGFNLGIRHMTISTSGIVPGILKFADENAQANLAISLHAPNNEIRNQIMPVNQQHPLEKLLPAVSEYMEKTGRKVFFEYILLRGINDSTESIEEMISLMRKYFSDQMRLVHVNLIEYNPVSVGTEIPTGTTKKALTKVGVGPSDPTQKFEAPSHERTREIFDYLQKNKILSTIRYRFGDDISAACGQLSGLSSSIS